MKKDSVEIFQTIRAVMQPYEMQGFVVRTNSEESYDLWSEKNIEVDGESKTELHFAAVNIEDGGVYLYLEPTILNISDKLEMDPALAALEKNNSCFSISQLDNDLLDKIDLALATRSTLYKQKDWV